MSASVTTLCWTPRRDETEADGLEYVLDSPPPGSMHEVAERAALRFAEREFRQEPFPNIVVRIKFEHTIYDVRVDVECHPSFHCHIPTRVTEGEP